jgi:hypothetical protein
MSAPIFLNSLEFLDILIAELPDGVYPTDYADSEDVSKRSISSSELRAIALQLGTASDNLAAIYSDKFLSLAGGDGLTAYERDYFATTQDGSLSLDDRRANLISKLRATGGISLPAVKSVVESILGDIPFDLLPYSGQGGGGAWILGTSALGVSSWLGALDPLIGARSDNGLTPLDCNLAYAADGLSLDQLASIQRTAFTYEVRIYGAASDQTLMLLDQRLSQLEPARSTHIIRNNQVLGPADFAAYKAQTPEFDRLRL